MYYNQKQNQINNKPDSTIAFLNNGDSALYINGHNKIAQTDIPPADSNHGKENLIFKTKTYTHTSKYCNVIAISTKIRNSLRDPLYCLFIYMYVAVVFWC